MKISRHNLTLPILYMLVGLGIYSLSKNYLVIGIILTAVGSALSLVGTIAYSVISFGGGGSNIVTLPWWSSKRVISSDYIKNYRIAYDKSDCRTHLYQEVFFGFFLKLIKYDHIGTDNGLVEWIKREIESNEQKYQIHIDTPYHNFNGYINKKDERLNKINKVL